MQSLENRLKELKSEPARKTFDQVRSHNQELTFTYATKFFAENNLSFAKSTQKKSSLFTTDGAYTNAALLLSDQCEHLVKCAVFQGTDQMRFKARKEFGGSILKQLNDAYEYIDLSNNLNTIFEGLRQVDHPDYPEDALQESLLNAIMHRDYSYSGPILVKIFDDRMEFISLGGLVGSLTREDITQGGSQVRNTVIAEFFAQLKLSERGKGISRIFAGYEECKEKPQFLCGPASFVTILPNRSL